MLKLVQLILLFTCFVWKSLGGLSDEHDLIMAAANGEVDRVIDFVKHKNVYISTKNNYGVSPIIFAANNGHLNVVKLLLNYGAPIDDKSNNGKSPLMWATLWGHTDVAVYLIDHGADLNIQDIDGMSALMTSVFKGHRKIAEHLIINGANVTLSNNLGADAYMIAKNRGDKDLIKLFEPYFPVEPTEQSPYYIFVMMVLTEIMKLYRIFVSDASALLNEWQILWSGRNFNGNSAGVEL